MKFIIDPITLKSYSLISINGINTLKSYITHYQSGGSKNTGGASKRTGGASKRTGGASKRTGTRIGSSIASRRQTKRAGQPLRVRTHNIGQCNIYGWDIKEKDIGTSKTTSYYHSPRSGNTYPQRTVQEYLNYLEERVLNATDIFLLQEVCSDGTTIFEDRLGNTWDVYWHGTHAQRDRGILVDSYNLPIPTAIAVEGKWKFNKKRNETHHAVLINNGYTSSVKGCAVVCKRVEGTLESSLYNKETFGVRSSPIVKVTITSNANPRTVREIYVCSIHIPVSNIEQHLEGFQALMEEYIDSPFVFGGDFNSPPAKRQIARISSSCFIHKNCRTSYGTGNLHGGRAIDDIYFNKFDKVPRPNNGSNGVCSAASPGIPPVFLISDFDHKFLTATAEPPKTSQQKISEYYQKTQDQASKRNIKQSNTNAYAVFSSSSSVEESGEQAEAEAQTTEQAEAEAQPTEQAEETAQNKSIKKQLKSLEGNPSKQEKINELVEYIHRNNISLDTFESVVTNRKSGKPEQEKENLNQIEQSIKTKINNIKEAETEAQRQPATKIQAIFRGNKQRQAQAGTKSKRQGRKSKRKNKKKKKKKK